MSTHYEALARTTLLLNQEWFDGQADEAAVADALLGSTVRLAASTEALSCRAGQTAFVTAFLLTARLGIGIELIAPNVLIIDRVAPLRLPHLVDSLIEIGGDLIPGARVRTTHREAQETFVFGTVDAELDSPTQVVVTDFAAELKRGSGSDQCVGELPFGGFAAGAAVAAIALDAARTSIERATGLSARTPRPSPGPPVGISLQELLPGLVEGLTLDLADVDVISGGAITHAVIFCLLRVPGVCGRLRVIEKQHAELSNVNRYPLLRASDDGRSKVEHLESLATTDLQIQGVPSLYTKETRGGLLPLAKQVLVGVDDVEARWWVQEENPEWLAVAATGNHLAQLTTHIPGSPCAACIHHTPLPPQTIPTISFVSFWAGLLQACALVTGSSAPHNIVVFPFALGGISGSTSFSVVTNPQCPVKCAASEKLVLAA